MKYYFRCPKCGNDEQFVKPAEQSGSYNGGFLGSGGIMGSLAFADYAASRVQCPKCFYLFRQPPVPRSSLGRFAGWMLIFAIVPTVAAALFLVALSGAGRWPSLAPIEEAVAANPSIAIYLVAVQFVLITIPSFIVMLVSDARYRKLLATQYRLYALSPREFAKENRASTVAAEAAKAP